jgi:hypothetical protein
MKNKNKFVATKNMERIKQIEIELKYWHGCGIPPNLYNDFKSNLENLYYKFKLDLEKHNEITESNEQNFIKRGFNKDELDNYLQSRYIESNQIMEKIIEYKNKMNYKLPHELIKEKNELLKILI